MTAAAQEQGPRGTQDFGQLYRDCGEQLQQLARAHHETLLHLSVAADFKDDDTGVHIVRIGYLAEALALYLGQPPGYAGLLRKTAPMHDVGKIGTPDHVLRKAGPLSEQERNIMTRHPEVGAEILGKSHLPVFAMAAEIALTHHERYDGTGYPRGLRGEEIPLSGRITSLVDIFDALTMDRVYRPAFPVNDALRMIAAERGKALDPLVVDTFIAHADELDALRRRITNECPSFAALIDTPDFRSPP